MWDFRPQMREKLLRLWYHENVRVFSDRLINDTDRTWFDDLLRDTMKEIFEIDPQVVVGETMLFYGDFCAANKEYEQITDIKKVEDFFRLK